MPTLKFKLSISSEDYLRYYQGRASQVAVTTEDGQRLKFPAEHLRPFLSHDGIYGRFELEFDQDNRFVSLHKK